VLHAALPDGQRSPAVISARSDVHLAVILSRLAATPGISSMAGDHGV